MTPNATLTQSSNLLGSTREKGKISQRQCKKDRRKHFSLFPKPCPARNTAMITNEKETQNVGKVGAKRREKKVGIKLTI